MTMADTIRQALERGLRPSRVDIVDESALHAGHAGARPEGETHYRLTVVADRFEGLSRVERQRFIYSLLDEAFERGLHALAMTTKTPGEHRE